MEYQYTAAMKQDANRSYLLPFALVTSLFFFWGFVHNMDPILIPHLKKSFSLTTLQSSLVDSAVYIGYFLMALPAGMIMKRYGYKTGILTGLLADLPVRTSTTPAPRQPIRSCTLATPVGPCRR